MFLLNIVYNTDKPIVFVSIVTLKHIPVLLMSAYIFLGFPIPEWLSSSFIMTNIIVGIGLLNFPKAYADAGGLQIAVTLQFVCATIYTQT